MNEACIYTCGPYKGYCGKAEFDADDKSFSGEVVGLRDVVTFEADAPLELGQAFRDSVDAYLAFCAERKEKPEKPFSGKFIARLEPEVHKALSGMAEVAGKSLNQLIAEQLKSFAELGESSAAQKSKSSGATNKRVSRAPKTSNEAIEYRSKPNKRAPRRLGKAMKRRAQK